MVDDSKTKQIIKFNIPTLLGSEQKYVNEVFRNNKFSGNHQFSKECCKWFRHTFSAARALMTPSCTHSLEMAAILADIGPEDEVIMASYNFTSTANAFVLRGAQIVFVDIQPDTMNIDANLIERAITKKTKLIVAMHYAGVPCEMDAIMKLAKKYRLIVVEDAAQAIMSRYRGALCGTIGQFGCFSFHETKNIQCGEGGALLVNDRDYAERAEIIQEKGTNRSKFFRGEIDKYSWVDLGSSYLTSEFNAAFLLAQIENIKEIIDNRVAAWNRYHSLMNPLAEAGKISLPMVPAHCEHNGHIYYIKTADLDERSALIQFMRQKQVMGVFHYIPLHSAIAGKKFGRFHGDDIWCTRESGRLVRLPLYHNISDTDIDRVADVIYQFYGTGK